MLNEKVTDDHFDPPVAQLSDYVGIGVLTAMLCVGGPLNILSFLRSLGIDARNLGRRGQGSMNPARRRAAFTLNFHLTVSNLMIIWVYVLSEVCWRITYQWMGGDALCRLVRFSHAFCFYATSNLVSTIALDRLYIAVRIDRPGGSRARRNAVRWFARCAWTLAAVCSLPQLYVWQTFEPFPGQKWQQCVTIWMAARYGAMADVKAIEASLQALTTPLDGKANDNRTAVTADSVNGAVTVTQEANAVTVTPDFDEMIRETFEKPIYEEEIYNGFHLAVVFWLPVLVIICCYGLIVTRFNRDIRKRSECEASSMHEAEALSTSNHCSTPTSSRSIKYSPHTGQTSVSAITMEKMIIGESTAILNHKRDKMAAIVKCWQQKPQSATSQPLKLSNLIRKRMTTSGLHSGQPSANFAACTLTRAKRRTVRTSLWILLAYLLCWSPYNILSLWRYIHPTSEYSSFEILNDLIVLNAVVNPLIYGI